MKSIHLDNPSAKVLVDIAKTQDDEVGDGTTSVAVLAGELLREAERLVTQQKLHPQNVIMGYRFAVFFFFPLGCVLVASLCPLV